MSDSKTVWHSFSTTFMLWSAIWFPQSKTSLKWSWCVHAIHIKLIFYSCGTISFMEIFLSWLLLLWQTVLPLDPSLPLLKPLSFFYLIYTCSFFFFLMYLRNKKAQSKLWDIKDNQVIFVYVVFNHPGIFLRMSLHDFKVKLHTKQNV